MAEEESLKAEMSALLRGDIERARERREQPPAVAEPEPPASPEPEAAPEARRGFRRFFGQA